MPVIRRPKGKRDSAPQVQHRSSLAPDSTTRHAQSPTIIIPARPHLRLHSRPEPEPETEPPQQAETAPEPEPWRHPDELLFIHPSPFSPHPPSSDAAKEWTDPAILRLVRASAFTIPPRPASISRATSPFVIVRCPRALFFTINGSGGAEGEMADLSEEDVDLPRAYRMPLLWVQKFLWLSVALALPLAGDTEPERQEKERNWDEDKWDLVHVARLCQALLSSARNENSREGGIPKTWRYPPFDRALRRYWHRWLVSRDEFVRDFWKEFGEEEFEDAERGGDVLKLGWPQWVLKGHKGFFLTKEEAANGISAEELLRGSGIEDALASVTQKQIAQVNVPAQVQNDVQMNSSVTLASESRSTSSSSPKSASTTPTLVARQQPESRQASGTPNNVPTPGTVQPAAALVRGSVSLGALVSRIPLGGGRHRVPGQGARVAGTRVVSQSESQNITTATQTVVQMTAHRTNASAASSLPTPPAQPHPSLSGIAQTNGKVKTKSKPKSKSRKEKAALLPDFTSFRPPEEPQERELISVGGEGEAPGNENGHAPDTEMDVRMRDVPPIADDSSVPQNAIPDVQATELVCPPLRIQYQEKINREVRQETEEDLAKDSVDTRMQDTRDAQQQLHEEQEQREADTPIIEGNNSDLDDDEEMELLYPDESSPVQLRHPSVLSPLFSPKSPSRSISAESRSPSPTVPALSSARFPSEAPSGTNPVLTFTPASTSVSSSQFAVPSASAHISSTSTPSQLQLQLSPRGAFASLEPVAAAADPNTKQQLNLLTRLTQSWSELQAEVSALRAELRASGGTTHAHLEERVRTLEEAYSTPAPAPIPTFATPTPIEKHPRSASMPLQSDASVVGARGHPLQHLISGEEEEHRQMDVDVEVPTPTRYAAGATRKEELPPRSRKFGSAARMGGI
ncbi:hypothetical protein DFH08DRAFT_867555 [Mycena albidolilacea]|uniref:Uncharacterized protein n=1 Tax=Mycena albidolilacea TaxID=1033008 RepID=A0AAD7A0Q7_9AGAR|nr:hypothetical protein DFH08DRAFT_867555 [Mycena albidolilacea]